MLNPQTDKDTLDIIADNINYYIRENLLLTEEIATLKNKLRELEEYNQKLEKMHGDFNNSIRNLVHNLKAW